MAHLSFQVFFLLCLNFSMSESKADSPSSQMVSAFKDEAVTLSCSSLKEADTESCHRFRWIKYSTDSKAEVISEWPKRRSNARSVAKEVEHKGFYPLKNLKKTDEGLYSCEIWKGWERVLVKNTTLKLKYCESHSGMKAAPRTSVKLNCPVNIILEEPQNISWAMMKGVTAVSVASERVQINGSSLVIQSVVASDSGWYRCNYTIGQTWECHDINLNVQGVEHTMAPRDETIKVEKNEESSKTLVAVVTSVIFGIFVAALIGFFLYRRQKSRRLTYLPQTAGGCTEIYDAYECVDLSPSRYHERVNSFYNAEDESMRTFDR